MLVFDLLTNNGASFDGSDYIAVLSDKIDCGLYKNGAFISAEPGYEIDLSKLLELRIFNEKAELRYGRRRSRFLHWAGPSPRHPHRRFGAAYSWMLLPQR